MILLFLRAGVCEPDTETETTENYQKIRDINSINVRLLGALKRLTN
jgi:hypothetical protein